MKKLNTAITLYDEAVKAGEQAMKDTTPTPMIVTEHKKMFDDNSEPVKQYYVPSGVCGFAWVNVKCKGLGTKFVNGLKKAGIRINKDSYYGGFNIWIHEGGQSYELKTAYAGAFAKVLQKAGIPAYVGSRLD